MREALFYRVQGPESRVQCLLCPHNCLIADGKRGICGVRENQKGVLYSLVYGKVISAAIDPIEKKPLNHFLPGTRSYSIATVGCNFRCDFCQNFGISKATKGRKDDETRGRWDEGGIGGIETTPEEIVKAAIDNDCQSISYTYTEPTIFFEFAYDCAKLANAKGLKNIFVTNGYSNPEPTKMIAPYLDAANIDLKSFSDDYYKKYCGGRLQPVLDTIKLMRNLKIWIELTTLIIPGLNDSNEELTEIASFIKNDLGDDVPWHVSAFYPTYKMLDRPATPRETVIKAKEIGLEAGLKYVYTGNI
ncbi:MAG: AmmeMemoRadiSam system radical SAM enzyme [bacterium]